MLKESEGICYICGNEQSDKWDVEHVQQLPRQSTAQETILRAACENCDVDKACKERVDDTRFSPLTSVFCKHSYEQFHRKQKDAPLNLRPGKRHEERNFEVDLLAMGGV